MKQFRNSRRILASSGPYKAGDVVTVNFGHGYAHDDYQQCVILEVGRTMATHGYPSSYEYKVQILGKPNKCYVDESMLVEASTRCGRKSASASCKGNGSTRRPVKASMSASSFDKFNAIIDQYLSPTGEGDTLATQAVTAINKLVYKWYNDGDVFDNTRYLEGWANDLSSFANWLYAYCEPEQKVQSILETVYGCRTEDDYEDLLYELAECVLNESNLQEMNQYTRKSSIYTCKGPFRFVEKFDEEDDSDYEEYSEDEYSEEDEW